MTTYTVELTEIERACGVTLEQVAEELPRVAVRGDRVSHAKRRRASQ